MSLNQPRLWSESFGQIGAVLKALEKRGVTTEHFSRIRSDPKYANIVAKVMRGTKFTELLAPASEPLPNSVSLTLGSIKDPNQMLRLMRMHDMKVDAGAKIAVRRIRVSKTENPVEVSLLTAEYLGMPLPARFSDLISAAQTFGFDLCPEEVGPLLRLALSKQPQKSCVIVMSQPFKGQYQDWVHYYRIIRGDFVFGFDLEHLSNQGTDREFSGLPWAHTRHVETRLAFVKKQNA